MSSRTNEMEVEKLPLQQMAEYQDDNISGPPPASSKHDPNMTAGQSLIRHVDAADDTDVVSPYHIDSALVLDAYENPYKETTENTGNYIRRVPSSDLVPAPFTKFNHVIILSIVAIIFFVFIGVFAFRLARLAKMQHSKGLSGVAQKASKKSVILSYISIALGILVLVLVLVFTHTV